MAVVRRGKIVKNARKAQKFLVDASIPTKDKIFDAAAFEKFLHDKIKVNGRAGNLGDSVSIARNADGKISVSANAPMAKRYLKYLTKKFLKKHQLRDWLRVIANEKGSYQLRYYNIANEQDNEDED
ncbi:MAG: ribosomal protein L22e [Olpidium bornovanus]|uniref:Ribosomal protein L22e n=1 Tax=Olpidium bornovanus TaxID=278681 RepID=A0A8H8DM57_9FUNG|nr:MAG: ribosomal protein L22e [Olpidium bornovanus]